MKKSVFILMALSFVVLSTAEVSSLPPADAVLIETDKFIDNTSFIDANTIFMFVTNHGNFGRDLAGFFGRDFGTWYPFLSVDKIIANTGGAAQRSPLYAAGLWLAGTDASSQQLSVTISEYDCEYVPGPMSGGTYLPDNPSFRVYKLYKDSLADNPNADYLEWPVDQGAPIDNSGDPVMLGDQMLWTVFNDADPARHMNDAGSTAPLGIEVQQTMWATNEPGSDNLSTEGFLEVTQTGSSGVTVTAVIVDPLLLNGHDYAVETVYDAVLGSYWRLVDITAGETRLDNQTDFSGSSLSEVVDGFGVTVRYSGDVFDRFEVVANADGPLDPPEAGAFASRDFPTVLDENDEYVDPTFRQQSTGLSRWCFHTADDGGTCGDGSRHSFETFVSRVTRDDANTGAIGLFDYEMRFTGSYDNPGVGGSYAVKSFDDSSVFWVSFELWNIGIGTPDDPSDDVRLFPCIYDYGDDNTFNLESWGCIWDIYGGWGEHSASEGDDDPFTDMVYWFNPIDLSPGYAGYQAIEDEFVVNGDINTGFSLIGDEVFSRTVLVSWDGGEQPPFTQDLPEVGTIFRITTTKVVEPDAFTFTAAPVETIAAGPEAQTVYIKYKMYNRGTKQLRDCYVTLWVDPDIGTPTDDLIGCDTLNNLFFAYNADEIDVRYGTPTPAIGFKILNGPIVPSDNGDTAFFDGTPIVAHRNLGMTSFQRYINGTDPNSCWESFYYMTGLNRDGTPLFNGTHYAVPGDPVTGEGDIDFAPADSRMLGTCGPFDFNPGDSQFVLVKMACGLGTNRLTSITKVRDILNGTSPIEPATLKAAIDPNPLLYCMLHALEPISVAVTVGYDESGSRGLDIDYGSLSVNGFSEFDSVVISSQQTGFNGEVATLYYPVTDFLEPYGLLWDTTLATYTVAGLHVGGTPFSMVANVTLVGHRSGDFNLDDRVDIADLVATVNYFFLGGPAPMVPEVIDMNHDGYVNIQDLVDLVIYMF